MSEFAAAKFLSALISASAPQADDLVGPQILVDLFGIQPAASLLSLESLTLIVYVSPAATSKVCDCWTGFPFIGFRVTVLGPVKVMAPAVFLVK